MARNPLHIQILQSLLAKIEARRDDLRTKVGDGLEDREYQRHVGRIREATVLIGEIERYLTSGLDEVEDEDEETNSERSPGAERARRPSQRTRATQ